MNFPILDRSQRFRTDSSELKLISHQNGQIFGHQISSKTKTETTKRDDVFDTIYFIEFDENILHKRLTKTYNCFRFFYTTKTDNRNSIFRREKKLIIIFIFFLELCTSLTV